MARKEGNRRKLRGKLRGAFVLASAGLMVGAVAKELQLPKDERTWNGRIANVPYDFRMPTPRRIKRRLWAPDNASIFVPRAFGVGWDINFAAVTKLLKQGRTAMTQPSA
ncbi:MAG TPA: DUF5808 domain-containing protein [Acidothermaceae bacterium]|jgi:hypothetical protein